MVSTELFRSIYYYKKLNWRAEERLKKNPPNILDYSDILEGREKYWIDNNRKLFIKNLKKVGLFDFCKKIHRIVEKPETQKWLLETDDFYDETDRDGVWIILRFQERRLSKLNSMERMEEWKILTDMLDSWGKRFCKSFSQFSRERNKGKGHYGLPEIVPSGLAEGETVRRRRRPPDKKCQERRAYYKKWGIEEPEKERECIQKLLAEVKSNLRKKYELPEIPGLDDKRIGELCQLCRELRGYGIEVKEVEDLFEEKMISLKTLLRNLEKLWDAVAENNIAKEPQKKSGLNVAWLYRDCIRDCMIQSDIQSDITKTDITEISQKLAQDIYDVYTSVIYQSKETYSIKSRIKEMKEKGCVCNLRDIDSSLVESDPLVQLEYLDHLVNTEKIESRLEVKIHSCVKRAKEELINSYIQYKNAEVDFGPEDIELEKCVYSIDRGRLRDNAITSMMGKPVRRK